ncbi:unnamed protein product, partial [Polarella glacialis]
VEDVATAGVFGARCQVVTLRPRLVLTNASEQDLELRLSENRMLRLASGQSIEAHWQEAGEADSVPATSLCFRPLPAKGDAGAWSGIVLCSDAAAGSSAFAISRPSEVDEVWSVEVASDRGALAVSFREGSAFLAANRATRAGATMFLHPGGHQTGVEVPLGAEIQYGWRQPQLGSGSSSSSSSPLGVDVVVNGTRHTIEDMRRNIHRSLPGSSLSLVVSRTGSGTVLALEDCDAGQRGSSSSSSAGSSQAMAGNSWLQKVEIKLSRLGLSFVEEAPRPRELMYLHLGLIRLEWRQGMGDAQQLRLSISEAQVDCQLPGRVDAASRDWRRGSSLGLLRREQNAVVFANRGSGGRAFLSLLLQRGATSTRDLVIPHAEVEMDAMDVTVDDAWLDPFVNFVSSAAQSGDKESGGLAVRDVLSMAGQPIVEGYS